MVTNIFDHVVQCIVGVNMLCLNTSTFNVTWKSMKLRLGYTENVSVWQTEI